MKAVIFLSTLLFASLALAAGGGHGEAEIPARLIIVQGINFLIVIGMLTYLLRDKVKAYFQAKYETFRAEMNKASVAKEQAQRQRDEIKRKLNELEATAEESVKRAQVEAEELRQKMIADARAQAQRTEQDALKTAHFEIDRARSALRQELLTRAMDLAKETLQERVELQDQKRLQSEFVEKIQVVQ